MGGIAGSLGTFVRGDGEFHYPAGRNEKIAA
jgi:hypothetical protein